VGVGCGLGDALVERGARPALEGLGDGSALLEEGCCGCCMLRCEGREAMPSSLVFLLCSAWTPPCATCGFACGGAVYCSCGGGEMLSRVYARAGSGRGWAACSSGGEILVSGRCRAGVGVDDWGETAGARVTAGAGAASGC
jgi:hypothetical protein